MRTGRSLIVMALGLIASTALAQQQPIQNSPAPEPDQTTGPSTLSLANPGEIDFGFRGTIYAPNSDQARYQRYRDLRNGPFLDPFRFDNTTDHRLWDVRVQHVG